MAHNTTMPASEAARIAESHPAGGKYRSDRDPLVGATGTAGRHSNPDSTDGLVLDACAAAEMIAAHCESWSPEQILAHSEIAQVAFTEATRALEAPVPKSSGLLRRRSKDAPIDPAGPLRQAAAVLAEAHARISFIEA